jgi:hypothetical protein
MQRLDWSDQPVDPSTMQALTSLRRGFEPHLQAFIRPGNESRRSLKPLITAPGL